jgi:glycosyltransferase involved in cell wall biosynthesis
MISSDPLRLALVITELHPGGAERCLVELATRLDRRRFLPVVYSLGPRPPENRQLLIERLAAAEISAHFLDLKSNWQFFRGVNQLAALLAEQRAEIVQSFLFHANVIAARAAKKAGIHRLATGIRVADPRWFRTCVERFVTSNAQRIVCVSQSVAEFCRRRGFPAKKLVVIPNGIDVSRWRDAKRADLTQFGVPPGRRVIVYVGRLDKQKGLDGFAGRLPFILAELPQHDMLVVGDGNGAPLLRMLADEMSKNPRYGDRVHFAGWQSNVPEIIAASDLLVLPSRWEGMPNVILEAMAAGKPVFASPAEGVLELLGDAAAPQTTKIHGEGELFSGMIEILSNSELAADVGRRNQERAIQQFSIENIVAQYERLYFTLAGP